MVNFMEYIDEKLGESITSPSTSMTLNDVEGKRIAKALNARYLGFKEDYHVYWFDDKRFGSSYVGKDFDEALKNRNLLWHRFMM